MWNVLLIYEYSQVAELLTSSMWENFGYAVNWPRAIIGAVFGFIYGFVIWLIFSLIYNKII